MTGENNFNDDTISNKEAKILNQTNNNYYSNQPLSPTKNMEEKKKKEFQQRKAEMLSLFETTAEEAKEFQISSPTSQTMKNSLDRIGNPNPRIHPK